ncbi:PHB/PHA accumulation regulator DNA-binding domain protein [Aquisphaera giovannonii]|uniref:PHB/PHA accumulation regulator DNA-binding domain protein n=1 Tax=Aquisphaera giovannonii TaxID=406548 RepID=A0A5B9WA14_9BACT|nr:polyhydroxyalkanoate synthesis regulator DNA-binding domain-containing protein [Aquisphaera giovannonii]QEH36921.1 PHB/PHA accumulation regulator DNA-binding domain protein [Aquisphaera giovannonii]
MAATSAEVVSIRRYPNRRLYDRRARKYITLQDLEDLVLDGKKIEVRDSRTNEDLTRAILTQILLERHPEKMEMFPVAMLHSILQANDLVLEFLRTYLRQSMAILEQIQQPGAAFTPFLAPMDWMRAMIPPNLSFPAVPEAEPARRLEAIDGRIAELEARLRRLEEPSEPAPSASAAGHSASDRSRTIAEESAALDRLEKRLAGLEGKASRRKPKVG